MLKQLTWRSRACLIQALCCLCLCIATSATASVHSAFAAKQVRSTDLSAFTKWSSVLSRYEYQHAYADDECNDDHCNSRRWEKLLVDLDGKPVAEQIRAVNSFFNAFRYVNDIDNWGVEDYWNTPYELMSRGGDCEDYAIAKYISLKRLGVPTSAMRLMVVQDMNLDGEMHAILEVKIDDTSYILDNQTRQVAIESKIYHYHPLYAINESAWWAYQ